MKRLFDLLTTKELKELKEFYLAKGLSERVFYNLKKKPLTIEAMQTAYKMFGIIYDFKTDTLTREQRTRVMTIEEIDHELDKYL